MARSILITAAILSPGVWLVWWSAAGGEVSVTFLYALAVGALSILVWLILEIATFYKELPARRLVRACFSVLLILFVTVGTTHWPLRLSFAIWRTQLDQVRLAIESGNVQSSPTRIGPFNVVRTEMMRDRWPALVVRDEHTGPTRLIYTREAKVGNTWSEIRLSEDWVLNSED